MKQTARRAIAVSLTAAIAVTIAPLTVFATTSVSSITYTEELKSTSTIYAGEIISGGNTVIKYLYSDDFTINHGDDGSFDILRTVLNGMNDKGFYNLVSDVNIYEELTDLKMEFCSDAVLAASMNSDWKSAARVAQEYFPDITVTEEKNKELYDYDGSFKTSADNFRTMQISDIKDPIDAGSHIITHIDSNTTTNVYYTVEDGQAVRHYDTTVVFQSEAVTVIYTCATDEMNFKYRDLTDGTIEITKYTGSADEVFVPGTIDGKTVTSIGPDTANYSYEIFTWVDSEGKIHSPRGIHLPDTLKNIGSYAFSQCTELTDIDLPDQVESIGDNSFMNCEKLRNITIPGSVTSISGSAFNRSGLENYAVDESNAVYASENGLLLDKAKKTLVSYPFARNEVTGIPATVTAIGDRAFYGCQNLTSVTVPDTVEAIGSEAFSQCGNLKTIVVGDSVKEIGSQAFANCTNLEYVKLPQGLTEIPEKLFLFSGNFTVNIPASVKSIAKSAFSYSNITSVTLPEGLESIGNQAFFYCSHLQSVDLPETLQTISANAFVNCKNMTSAKLRSASTAIGGHSLGFMYNSSSKTWEATEGFTITAPCDSTAQEYAQNNGFAFVATDEPLVNNSYADAYKLTVGSRIYLNGSAQGGTGDITYTYYYKRKNAINWLTLGGENCSYTSVFLTPKSAGEFMFRIVVRDRLGKTAEKDFDISIVEGNSTAFKNTSTLSTDIIQPKKRLYFYGSTEGAEAPVRYAYYYKRNNSSVWRRIGTEFTETKSASFKPTSEGEYDIKIDAIDANDEIVSKLYSVIVSDKLSVNTGLPLENNSHLGAQTVASGTHAELIGEASGGTTPYRYAYYYRRTGNKMWRVTGTEFGTATNAFITPKSTGTFEIRIVVKDYSGETAEKLFTLEVE